MSAVYARGTIGLGRSFTPVRRAGSAQLRSYGRIATASGPEREYEPDVDTLESLQRVAEEIGPNAEEILRTCGVPEALAASAASSCRPRASERP